MRKAWRKNGRGGFDVVAVPFKLRESEIDDGDGWSKWTRDNSGRASPTSAPRPETKATAPSRLQWRR